MAGVRGPCYLIPGIVGIRRLERIGVTRPAGQPVVLVVGQKIPGQQIASLQ